MSSSPSRKRFKSNEFTDNLSEEKQIESDDEIGSDEEEWEQNFDDEYIEDVEDQSPNVRFLNPIVYI